MVIWPTQHIKADASMFRPVDEFLDAGGVKCHFIIRCKENLGKRSESEPSPAVRFSSKLITGWITVTGSQRYSTQKSSIRGWYFRSLGITSWLDSSVPQI